MKLRHLNKNPGSPNFYALYASGFAAVSALAWPYESGDFGQKVISSTMGTVAVFGYAKTIAGYRINYLRRAMREEALKKSTTLGAARFADFLERSCAGLHDLKNGLLLGASGLPLTLPPGRSLACEAAPGTGKTTCVISPSLIHALETGASVFVQDVKFELFHLWSDILIERGFRVFVNNLSLNPDYKNHSSNPFAPIIEAAQSTDSWQETFTIAEALSRTLIKGEADAKSKFFQNGDRNVFIAVVVGLAVLYPERCYPGEVYRTIFHPTAFENLLVEARACDALEGDLAAIAANLLQKRDDAPEHLENFRAGASNALSFCKPSSELGSLGASHEFDPKTVRDVDLPPAVVFDLIPGDRVEVFGPANALLQTSRIQILRRHRKGRRVLFLIDERTNAPVGGLVEAIEMCRSWNIDIVLAYQSMASLIKTYGKQQADAILSSCAELYFSVSSYARAEEISKRIGNHTVKTTNFGFDESGKPNTGFNEASHPVLSADEIMALPNDEAILLNPGMRPVRLQKTPWYEIEPHKSWAGDNPHEEGHSKSPRTWFHLTYSADAHALVTPTLQDEKTKADAAKKADAKACSSPRIKRVRFADFSWVAVAGAVGFAAIVMGTPHMLLVRDYFSAGQYACTYAGLSGVRSVRQSAPCSRFQMIRFSKR